LIKAYTIVVGGGISLQPKQNSNPNLPKFSICIIHFNNVSTIRTALESILSQITKDFEVVIVDNCSNDGSQLILDEYAAPGIIRLVRKRSSRGLARQIALENSSGEYIIANMDMDDCFEPQLLRLLSLYHACCEGDLLWVRSNDPRGYWGGGGFTIAPRTLLIEMGGWRDLQVAEDWELASRAAKIGKYKWSNFNLLQSVNAHDERKNWWRSFMFRYVKYRDMLRCGRQVFDRGEKVALSQMLPYFLAKIALPLFEKYNDPFNKTFDPYDKSYFVNLTVQEIA